MSLDDRLVAFDWSNALESFKPASALAESLAAAPKDKSRVSVADLKSAGVWIEWYEAVAIVQAACRAIIESGDLIGPARLEPKAVVIDAKGAVTVGSRGPRSAPDAIQSLGNILSDVLPTNDFMLIRTNVASKATSSPPFYHSLEEFSTALAYYERPNRAQLLQGVYDRWCGSPAAQAPPPSTASAPVTEAATREPLVPSNDETPDRSRNVRLAAVAAALIRSQNVRLGAVAAALILMVAIFGAGIWFGMGAWARSSGDASVLDTSRQAVGESSSSPATDSATAREKPGAPSTDAAPPKQSLPQKADASRRPTGFTSTSATSPRTNRVETTSHAKTATAPRTNRVGAPSNGKAASSALTQLDQVGLPSDANTAPSTAPRVDRAGTVNDDATTLLASTRADRAAARDRDKAIPDSVLDPNTYGKREVDVALDPRTYNVSDIGVDPPVVLYPQTLVFSPEARRDIVATIEVVVNERGTVDTVRLVNDPRNIGEYLLVTTSLSAVKSWRFRPASKDGHAVRYRTVVPLITR